MVKQPMLEGSVFVGGAAVQWCDEKMIDSAKIESLGLYQTMEVSILSSLTGLGAPHLSICQRRNSRQEEQQTHI
jgi:glycerol kinase